MPLEDVADLLTRWQRARTPAEQLRVAATGARTLRSLSGDDRRLLAQALAEHGAPAAAARLATHGSGRLSPSQLTEVVTAAQGMDRTQLAALATALADPAERRRLSGAAADVPAPPREAAASRVPPPPPDAPTGPAVALPPPVDDAPDTEATPEPRVVPTSDGPSDEPTADGPVDEPTADGPVDEPTSDGPVDEPTGGEPIVRAPAAGPAPGAADVPAHDVTALLSSIDQAGSARDRRAAVTALAGVPLSGADLVAALRRLPDGWQRRTAARRILMASAVVDVDAEDVLASLGRRSDRTAIAHTLVGTGLAHVATVTDHLDERSADRVRRRAARTG